MLEVWAIDLARKLPAEERVLSPGERLRADRFVQSRDRRRFIRARAALRTILAGHMGVAPERVEFAYGAHGAPRIASTRSELRFSLSHSGELALVAVTRARPIGIDLEDVRCAPAMDVIAARWFHPGERSRLERCAPHTRPRSYYDYWTAKEAYVKALERGLRKPLAEFEIDVRDDGRIVLVSDAGDETASGWTFHALDVAPSHAATLAVQGSAPPPRIVRFA